MNTRKFLKKIMSRYVTENAENPDTLEDKLIEFMNIEDGGMEGYSPDEVDAQREVSVKFAFGHNHDFGTFKVEGIMQDRHLDLMEMFIDDLGLPKDLTGKNVLDVGIWCGGTTLLLAGMGATRVVGIEEVLKYFNCAMYLSGQFELYENTTFYNDSLYDIDHTSQWFDYIIFPGVLYHLSDPIVALRILFNALKDGGELYLETAYERSGGDWLSYRGPGVTGNNWFVPSQSVIGRMLRDVGFEVEKEMPARTENRYIVKATRSEWKPMMKAGLSRRVR